MQLDTILHGDALAVLRTLPDASVDAIVTDPPAGIAFMGKDWDNPNTFPLRDRGSLNGTPEHAAHKHGRGFANGMTYDRGNAARDAFIAFLAEIMRETYRVLKPGGHALVWALPRTSHWTAMALEDAGFEVRDRLAHVFGSGFPKSLDVSKQIDKAAGAEREVVGKASGARNGNGRNADYGAFRSAADGIYSITAPATDAACQWDGWGTALKPSVEDWWLCRKPLSESTVAANVLRWGTGALNIGATRVGSDTSRGDRYNGKAAHGKSAIMQRFEKRAEPWQAQAGRWPSHLLLSHTLYCDATGCDASCPIAELDRQSGIRKSGGGVKVKAGHSIGLLRGDDAYHFQHDHPINYSANEGGASRYFQQFRYVAKASRANRGEGNTHPTCKNTALMSWLITLITPPGGIVLDPFAGSGSTCVAARDGGWHYIGIEREAEYVQIARARCAVRAVPLKPKTQRRKRTKVAMPTLLEVSA